MERVVSGAISSLQHSDTYRCWQLYKHNPAPTSPWYYGGSLLMAENTKLLPKQTFRPALSLKQKQTCANLTVNIQHMLWQILTGPGKEQLNLQLSAQAYC